MAKKRPLPAVGYARISKQDTARDVSIDVQRAALERYAADNGYTLAGIHVDEGVSGGKLPEKRPGCRAALADADRLSCPVIVYDLSRLSRDVEDSARLRKKYDVLSVTESGTNGSGAATNLAGNTLAMLAQYHREVVGEKTKAALAKLRASGKVYSHRVPFGFRAKGGRLVADEVERAAIDAATKRRSRGATFKQIAADWTAAGLKPHGGAGKWYEATVRDILAREKRDRC